LPLGRFYPELADAMLLCATEMSRRAEMDRLAEVWNVH
jgi:glycine dehydrogenase subunit 1